MVEATATINKYSNIADVESGLLSELRSQAALAGANGLIDVIRETLVGGVVMSSTEWGTITKNSPAIHFYPKVIQARHDRSGSISQGYFLVYRAKAIRHDVD